MMMARLALVAGLVTAVAVVQPAHAQAPPGPPGPPPGNGTDLPAPPGTAPAYVPPGTPAAVPGPPSGPGLLTGSGVALNRARRTFDVALACQANGRVRVRARGLAHGTVARGGYRCSNGRAKARLKLTARTASRLVRRHSVPATASVKQGAHTSTLDFNLTAGRHPDNPKGFWTDGHLDCSGAYLVQPDYTTATPTMVSTRGWLAWYTPRAGWHWLGTDGENAGRWDTWTATVQGIAQFHPNGQPAPSPWTWGPIAIPPGNGTYAVGVYEIVYWVGGHPDYQWQYVNAGTAGAAAAGGGTLYCTYP